MFKTTQPLRFALILATLMISLGACRNMKATPGAETSTEAVNRHSRMPAAATEVPALTSQPESTSTGITRELVYPGSTIPEISLTPQITVTHGSSYTSLADTQVFFSLQNELEGTVEIWQTTVNGSKQAQLFRFPVHQSITALPRQELDVLTNQYCKNGLSCPEEMVFSIGMLLLSADKQHLA